MGGTEDIEAALNPRQLAILETVRGSGYATIEALAEAYGVSAQTVRRDVIRLDEAGLLQRFHGGAGLPEDGVRLSYRQKRGIAVELTWATEWRPSHRGGTARR